MADSTPTPSDRFCLASDLIVKRHPSRGYVVQRDGVNMIGSEHTLAILDTFSQPRTLAEALNLLTSRTKGPQGWMDLTSEIINLTKIGVLSNPSRVQLAERERARGFAGCSSHHRMLSDRTRTERYLEAIRQTVRPGDVVLDIGTGSGILAIAAAKAGASRVYAVESSAIGHLADAMFEANGVADRVKLVRGLSTEIELPERADVLICELIGDEPLNERIQEVCRDAMKRLLKTNARLVPSRLVLKTLPVGAPSETLDGYVATDTTAERWHHWYDTDFSAFASYSRSEFQYAWIRAQDALNWDILSEPVTIVELDLRTFTSTFEAGSAMGAFTRDGSMNGVLLYFEANLAAGIHLSTHPTLVGADNHWRSMLRLVDPCRNVHHGEVFRITYSQGLSHQAARLDIQVDPPP